MIQRNLLSKLSGIPLATDTHNSLPKLVKYRLHIPSTAKNTTLTWLATMDIDNTTSEMVNARDSLDERDPPWWVRPPQELTRVLPLHPHTRITRTKPGQTRLQEKTQFAFLFIFTLL
jgi:hypothetical protein